MIRSAVTICQVEQARRGPFVFHGDVQESCARAARLGFDGVELFLPDPEAVEPAALQRLLKAHGLRMAAVGTGAGWLVHGLSLTDPDPAVRQRAVRFVEGMIDFGARFGAPAIIGSMQGRGAEGVDRATALGWLAEALQPLGARAEEAGVNLLYEPLNRYETDLCNTLGQGAELLATLRTDRVRLLADLFHMNIEEADLGEALRAAGPRLGHLHFVDSNRRAAGLGHLDFRPVAAALREMGWSGYASAEAFPLPDDETAARATREAHRRLFG